MIVYTPPKAADRIPLIDLDGSFDDAGRRRRIAWNIHKACRETGFFYVSGHGVPQALMDAQIAQTRRFFAQDDAAKHAVAVELSPCRRGYEGVGRQILDEGSPADLKESFMLARDLADDHPLVMAGIPMQGPNQWPAALPGFQEQMLAYQAEMIRLGRHLMGCLAQSVDLDVGWFDDGLADPQCGIRLLRYPPQPAKTDFNRLGAGAHSDWGSITILLQDDMAGLEVRNADGDWIVATPIAGTFVINLGQMMERFTAGLYRANLHRVRNNSGDKPRHSVATFFELDPTYTMVRAPTCPADDAFAPANALTIGAHLEQTARASYGG